MDIPFLEGLGSIKVDNPNSHLIGGLDIHLANIFTGIDAGV